MLVAQWVAAKPRPRPASIGAISVITPRRPSVQRIRTASPWFAILWFARSLGLGAGDAHDLAPFLGFGFHEGGEILAEGGARLGAEIVEARRDVARLEHLGDRVDQPGRRAGGVAPRSRATCASWGPRRSAGSSWRPECARGPPGRTRTWPRSPAGP